MTTVGGQAVLEGVMMRGPSNWAVAVRKPDGDIAQVHQPIHSPMARHWAFRIPVVRGVIALGESLAIGFRALAISANYAAQEPSEDGAEAEEISTELTRGQLIFAFAIAIGFAVALFKVTPALITNWIGIEAGWFVIVEGLKAGRAVTVEAESAADGLNGPYAGENCVAVCSALGVESVLVSEDDLVAGFRFLYGRMKLACELAGAATAAALLAGKVEFERGQKVAAVVSGGNVAPKTAAAILASDHES